MWRCTESGEMGNSAVVSPWRVSTANHPSTVVPNNARTTVSDEYFDSAEQH
jgi:hypothetical protein